MVNTRRKKSLPYKHEWKIIVSGNDLSNRRRYYWNNSNVNPPPYHPDNYIAIRDTYSNRSRGTITKDVAHHHYETSTIVEFIDSLWVEIKPPVDGEFFFGWIELMAKEQNENVKRSQHWASERKDLQTEVSRRLKEYFPDFNKDENKHLILRILMTLGGE